MLIAAKRLFLFVIVVLVMFSFDQAIADASVVTITGRVRDIDALIAKYESDNSIKRIDMYETQLKPSQIEYIKSRLHNIEIGCQVWLVERHYVRTDATAYATRHTNKSKKHKSSEFAALKYCPDMMTLDLSHNDIDDISFLLDMPKLRVLLLGDNDIEDVSYLSQLRDLEYLELFKNKIKDVSPLASLQNLLDLNLSHNHIDDLTPLAVLKNVERLWVYNSNNYSKNDPVPKTVVDFLQSEMPNTHIDSTSYSTLGGWREHPRYYVVRNMIRGVHKWLPWDAEGLIPKGQ